MSSKAQDKLSDDLIKSLITSHSRERIFHFSFEGSLQELAAGEGGVWVSEPFIDTQHLLYRRHGAKNTDAPEGDPKISDIHGIAIQQIENTFGVDVVVNLVERNKTAGRQIIRGCHRVTPKSEEVRRHGDHHATRGLFVIQDNTRQTFEFPIEVYYPSIQTYSKGNMSLGRHDIGEFDKQPTGSYSHEGVSGIVFGPTADILYGLYSLVRNASADFAQNVIKTLDDGAVVLSQAGMDILRNVWTMNHMQKVTKIDLSELSVALAPAGYTWKEYLDYLRAIHPDTFDILASRVGKIKVGFKINYMIGGHGVGDLVENVVEEGVGLMAGDSDGSDTDSYDSTTSGSSDSD